MSGYFDIFFFPDIFSTGPYFLPPPSEAEPLLCGISDYLPGPHFLGLWAISLNCCYASSPVTLAFGQNFLQRPSSVELTR